MEWRNHPAELIIEKNKKKEEMRLPEAEPSARFFGPFVDMTKRQS